MKIKKEVRALTGKLASRNESSRPTTRTIDVIEFESDSETDDQVGRAVELHLVEDVRELPGPAPTEESGMRVVLQQGAKQEQEATSAQEQIESTDKSLSDSGTWTSNLRPSRTRL